MIDQTRKKWYFINIILAQSAVIAFMTRIRVRIMGHHVPWHHAGCLWYPGVEFHLEPHCQ